MIDLGIKPKETAAPEPIEPSSPKVSYPNFVLRDEQAEALTEELGGECKVGDEYVITARVRVTGVRDDNYGKSKEFDVVAIDEIEHGDEGDEGESEDEETPSKKRMVSKMREKKEAAY